MRLLLAATAAGLASIGLVASAPADPARGPRASEHAEAMARIERMIEAARTLNYEATFVYTHEKAMDQMRIVHRFDEEGERERLVSLSGATREVIRDDYVVTCIIPDSEAVVVGKSRPRSVYASPIRRATGIGEQYDLKLGEITRIAGRVAEQVVIRPKDQFRYGHRLWLDRDTGLLLGSELIDEHGKVLESIVYTSLALRRRIPDAELEPSVSGNGFTWYTTSPSEASSVLAPQWTPRWLPPGFTMQDGAAAVPLALGKAAAEHLVYGDGLASLSIYVEELDAAAEPLHGLSRIGAMRAFGKLVDRHQVTVVGEVPASTVRRVGESVTRRRD